MTKAKTQTTEEPVTYVDCSPRLSEKQYLDILDMNMACLKKEFWRDWKIAEKKGGPYADDSLHKAVDARYGFIKHWHQMLEADLYILDHICRVRGYDRAHLPGVVSCVVVNITGWHRGLAIYFRGKPLRAIPRDELKAEIERLAAIYKGEIAPCTKGGKHDLDKLKQGVEYYLRGQGYDTLDIEETFVVEA